MYFANQVRVQRCFKTRFLQNQSFTFLQSSAILIANFLNKVIEYLSKKGYTRTEAMLRAESAQQDVEGKPLAAKTEENNALKYGRALGGCR